MGSFFGITVPVFLVIAFGYVCARLTFFKEEAQKVLSLYVFYCAMPCYLFLAMAKVPKETIF